MVQRDMTERSVKPDRGSMRLMVTKYVIAPRREKPHKMEVPARAANK